MNRMGDGTWAILAVAVVGGIGFIIVMLSDVLSHVSEILARCS